MIGITTPATPVNALVAAGGTLRVNVAEAVGGKTVFGNLTVAGVVGAGFVTAYGCDDGIPKDSKGNISKADLNYNGAVSAVSSNRLIVKADADGDVCFYTLASAEMIVDINGVTDTGVTAIANQRTDTRTTTQPAVRGHPGDTKNCGDFATYAKAKAWLDTYGSTSAPGGESNAAAFIASKFNDTDAAGVACEHRVPGPEIAVAGCRFRFSHTFA